VPVSVHPRTSHRTRLTHPLGNPHPADSQVEWVQADIFSESGLATLKSILPQTTSVVHTLGILLETDYKSQGLSSLASGIAQGLLSDQSRRSAGSSGNPLATPKTSPMPEGREGLYERINRDSAVRVVQTYLETPPSSSSSPSTSTPPAPSPFVYISAEDIFRPVIPARYISTKRQAEERILRLTSTAESMYEQSLTEDNESERLERPSRAVRPVLLRPSE